MSCLMILATLSIFGQEKDFNQTFNKKPLQDFAINLNQKLDNKEVDLDKPFSVTLDGYLTKEGRFDVKRSRFTKFEGDEKMIAVAKNAIEAIGDSGYLFYLQTLGVEKIIFTLLQDETNLSAVIISELPSENKAKTVASGYKLLNQLAQENEKDDDVKTLLKASKITTEGKNFTLNFTLSKSEVHRLLKNELQKQKEKRYSNSGE